MTAPTAQPAYEALADLCAATRPDIDRGDLVGALRALEAAGKPWTGIMLAAVLMCAHGETPYDLRNATRAPWQHTRKDTTR